MGCIICIGYILKKYLDVSRCSGSFRKPYETARLLLSNSCKIDATRQHITLDVVYVMSLRLQAKESTKSK